MVLAWLTGCSSRVYLGHRFLDPCGLLVFGGMFKMFLIECKGHWPLMTLALVSKIHIA